MGETQRAISVAEIMGASVWVLWTVGVTAGIATALALTLGLGGWH